MAIGDRFTEGLNDLCPGEEDRFRGWADRLAGALAERNPGLRYANLAVRGKLLRQIVDDQVPPAVDLAPDLVTLCAGGNDMIRPGADPDALAVVFDDAVRRLRATAPASPLQEAARGDSLPSAEVRLANHFHATTIAGDRAACRTAACRTAACRGVRDRAWP